VVRNHRRSCPAKSDDSPCGETNANDQDAESNPRERYTSA